MVDIFVGEIRVFAFNFAPTGWALCDGQLLPVSQNTALFSLLGTTYGGDGRSTFALPNLMGCVAIQPGQGLGLSEYLLGQTGGSEIVTLLASEIPAHTHAFTGSQSDSTEQAPAGQLPAGGVGVAAYSDTAPTVPMADQALAPAGGSLPHNNMQPSLVMTYCIALQGEFPQRP